MLSPVGLLPAALVGIDIEALLAGAQQAIARAESDDLLQNPAALYAAAPLGGRCRTRRADSRAHALHRPAAGIRRVVPSALGGEPGKAVDRRGQAVHAGPTPVGAVGATDQHSQVQLFMEGPFDKVITFLAVDQLGEDVPIPSAAGLPADLAYLGGHTLGELLHAEYQATSAALASMGRMNCSLHLPEISATTIGEAFMFFQLATGYAGAWYGVNPFDQPGVELGKKLTYAAMGRPGFSGADIAMPPGDVV